MMPWHIIYGMHDSEFRFESCHIHILEYRYISIVGIMVLLYARHT